MDSATELPVTIFTATGKRNDSALFVPLLDEFEERYDTDGLEGVFGDTGLRQPIESLRQQGTDGASLAAA